MLKLNYKFIIPCFVFIMFAGCMRQPNNSSGEVWFDMQITYRNAAEQYGPALFKTNRLLEEQVLLLTFDEGTGDSSFDHTPYGNNAFLRDSNVWFTLDKKRSIGIEGPNTYALVNSNPVLNGTHGLKIRATINLYQESVTTDRIIVNKHDYYGGYTLGINRNRQVFFRVRNNDREKMVVSDSALTPQNWYTINATYSLRPPLITVFSKADSDTTNMPLTLPQTSNALVIGSQNNLAGLFTNPLEGLIDYLSITSTVNFADFDFVRVAIMDLNKFIQDDSLRRMSLDSLALYFSRDDSISVRYMREMHKIFYGELERTTLPSWAELRRLWDSYFTVVSEQNLQIDGGFATGTINGIPGLNLVTVGALRNNVLVYYGETLVWGKKDKLTSVAIELYPLEYE